MIKLKKIMALGLSALMVTSLVGCGGTTNATENKKSDSSKGTEITFWNSFTGADGDMLVKMVDKFNKENKVLLLSQEMDLLALQLLCQ